MSNTPNLNITPVSQAQSQKEVTLNLGTQLLEMLQNNAVKNQTLAAPPVSPAEGDLYIVAGSPTGAWSGKAGKLAYYINAAWSFTTIKTGFLFWDANISKLQLYNGATIVDPVFETNPDFTTLGVNATPDSTNKLSVSSVAILFSNIGGDCKTYINKHAAGDGGSLVFETNFSERAEIGCIGDDTFQLKVSPDGSTFYQAWVIDQTNGNTDFKQNVTVDKLLTVSQFLSLPTASTLTIASGVVTATKSHHKIEVESGTTDDLDTISGGTGNAILLIEPNTGGHTIVVKHGTGNIKNKSGADVSISSYGSNWLGFWDGSNWLQIS